MTILSTDFILVHKIHVWTDMRYSDSKALAMLKVSITIKRVFSWRSKEGERETEMKKKRKRKGRKRVRSPDGV